jgi:hypothetical protein
MAGYRSSFAPDRCAKGAAARIPAASSEEGPPAVVVAAIGGGGGFDLHRCRGVEHEVHNIPAYSFSKYGASLAHEFNDRFLAVGLKPGTVRDPERFPTKGSYEAAKIIWFERRFKA